LRIAIDQRCDVRDPIERHCPTAHGEVAFADDGPLSGDRTVDKRQDATTRRCRPVDFKRDDKVNRSVIEGRDANDHLIPAICQTRNHESALESAGERIRVGGIGAREICPAGWQAVRQAFSAGAIDDRINGADPRRSHSPSRQEQVVAGDGLKRGARPGADDGDRPDVGARAIWFPADTPFCFELSLVRRQQRDGAGVLLNERSRAGPMNEDIPRPGKGVASRLQAKSVILRLEHPPLVPIVERTDSIDDVAPRRRTEQGNDANGRLFSVVVNRELLGKLGELFGVFIRNFDHGFRGGAVRPWSDQPDGRIGKVTGESGQPFGRDDRVVVEKDNNLALSRGEPPV
jgi:hypothetical protein